MAQNGHIQYQTQIQTDKPKNRANPRGYLLYRWSGRQDLNLRPSDPKSDALPNCATPRNMKNYITPVVLKSKGHFHYVSL
jgi:hypothetical protein